MKPKSFVYLAAAATLSVLLAILSFAANNQWSAGKATGEKLLPKLADSIREVAQIEIRQGDNAVVLEKKSEIWGIKSRDGYPLDVAKLRTLLVALGEAELIEPKTRRADRYTALELEDPAEKSAKSRLVRITSAKGEAIAEVVIGKKRPELYGTGKAGGTYVRRPGDPQSWLANVDLDAPLAVKDWVKTSVLTIDAGKISRVSIEIPGEQALKIERPAPAAKDAKAKDAKEDAKEPTDAKTPTEPAKLAFVAFPPEGKKLKDTGAAETLARALSSIDMEDVRKLAEPPAGEGVSVVKIEVADGPTTTLRLRKEGDAHWLSVAATGEGEAKKAAEEISGRTQGWEFKLPAAKAESILKKRSDLLQAPAS
jgi:hypothetical protein